MKMNKLLLLAALALSISSVASGQKLPTFSQYKTPVDKKRVITVDLKSHKDARMFRTNLRNAAKGGVNFAGHYVLTGWGCGTNCSQWAIIDARNGRVYFPKQFAGVGFGFCIRRRRDNEIFEDLHLFGFGQRGVDADALDLALPVERHLD